MEELPLMILLLPYLIPKDRGDKSKISYLIQQNFLGNELDLKEFEEYKELISYREVTDILDFNRGEFNKSFSLTPKKEIKTKWKLVKLGDITKVIAGQSPKSENYNDKENGLPFYQGKKDFGRKYLKEPTVWTTQVLKIYKMIY